MRSSAVRGNFTSGRRPLGSSSSVLKVPTVLLKTSHSYLYECPELSWGWRQLGWTSCLNSTGRVTLTSGTTFLHINALARLTGTTLGPDSNRGDRGMDSKQSFFKKPACLFQLDHVSKTYSCPFIYFFGNLRFRSSSQSRQILNRAYSTRRGGGGGGE